MPSYNVTFHDVWYGYRRGLPTEAPSPEKAISNIKHKLWELRRLPPEKMEQFYYGFRAEAVPPPPPAEPPPPRRRRRRRPETEGPGLFNPVEERMPFGVNRPVIVYDTRGPTRGPGATMHKIGFNPADETLQTQIPAELRVVVKPPSEYTADEIQAFKDMILREWQVSDEGLDSRIAACKVLVMIYAPEGLIATGAAKKPYSSYSKKVFSKAGLPGQERDYDFELGYIYVLPKYRGILLSRVLMKALLDSVGDASVFATVKTDNERMIRTNHRLGLKETGSPFQSERGSYMFLLFTRGGNRIAFRETEWEESERNPEE